MSEKKTIIIGATGLVGDNLLSLLLADSEFDLITALSRKQLSADSKKLKTILTTFEKPDSWSKEINTGSVIFCAIGTTDKKVSGDKQAYRKIDFDIPLQVAIAGIEKGYMQFVLVSAVGANTKSSNFYLRLKGEVEKAICKLPFQSIHIFRPSVLKGKRNERRPGEMIGKKIASLLSFLFIGKFSKYKPIEASELALAMLKCTKKAESGIHIYHHDEIKSICKK